MMHWKRRALVIGSCLLALVAVGVVALAALNYLVMRPKVLRFQMRDLRWAAKLWREHHSRNECPTTDQLHRDGAIDARLYLANPWGAPLHIVCEDDETFVVSPGPDHELGPTDDVRFPEHVAIR
jgi:hypothetical protein